MLYILQQQFSGGITNSKKKKEDTKQRRVAKVGGRWKDSIKGLDPPVGKFKNGILSLSQKDVKRLHKRWTACICITCEIYIKMCSVDLVISHRKDRLT